MTYKNAGQNLPSTTFHKRKKNINKLWMTMTIWAKQTRTVYKYLCTRNGCTCKRRGNRTFVVLN